MTAKIAITEPVRPVSLPREVVTVSENKWTALAEDGQRGALFSCMVEITTDGHRLLTPLLDGR